MRRDTLHLQPSSSLQAASGSSQNSPPSRVPSSGSSNKRKEAQSSYRILVADDEPTVRKFIGETLSERVYDVVEVSDGAAALQALQNETFDIAVLDIRMPGFSGLDLLEEISNNEIQVATVIVTAGNALESAVEAMKRGAVDFLTKPFGAADLNAVIDKAVRGLELNNLVELGELPEPHEGRTQELVGANPAMLDVFKTVGRIARRDIPVLITGESGTGKELVARAIHRASDRADQPFIAVNSAAIPRDLLESELFGHVKGSFTGAITARPGRFKEANGGTLFLDEIGDMPADLQAKLLRVLQEKAVTPVGGTDLEPVDVRIVAATHRDLEAAVKSGQFRGDLLYRIRVVPIHIPPLRERKDDISVLAMYFARVHGHILTQSPRYVAADTLRFLREYDWPGNVRELENSLIRALVMSHSEVLAPEDFDFLSKSKQSEDILLSLEGIVKAEVSKVLRSPSPDIYRSLMERIERPMLETVLDHVDGNQVQAANLLGINRNTLRKKILEIGLKQGREDT